MLRSIPQEVEEHLPSLSFDGDELVIPALPASTYSKLKPVLAHIGVEWNSRAKKHIVKPGYPAEELLFEVIQSGYMPKLNPHAYFPTPEGIVDRLFEEPEWRHLFYLMRDGMGDEVCLLEPSAGTGAIARRAAGHIDSRERVHCVEMDPRNAEHLRKQGFTVFEADYMSWEPPKGVRYVGVAMNPPFKRDTYVKHILKALDDVDQEDRRWVVSAILPTGFLGASSRVALSLREKVATHGTYSEHPDNSFKESGTNIATGEICLSHETGLRRAEKMDHWPDAHTCTLDLYVQNTAGYLDELPAVKNNPSLVRTFLERAAKDLRLTQGVFTLVTDACVEYFCDYQD